jgi:TusA-related sulfurtransferase
MSGPDVSGLPEHDLLLDERGRLCPLPIIALARAFAADPAPVRVLLLTDDPAAEVDVPAWSSLRGKRVAWSGPYAEGASAFLLTPA